MKNYALCDFCHKPHALEEVEKVKITYTKCKECPVNVVVGRSKSEPLGISLEDDLHLAHPPKVMPKRMPPPGVGGVFSPPPIDQSVNPGV